MMSRVNRYLPTGLAREPDGRAAWHVFRVCVRVAWVTTDITWARFIARWRRGGGWWPNNLQRQGCTFPLLAHKEPSLWSCSFAAAPSPPPPPFVLYHRVSVLRCRIDRMSSHGNCLLMFFKHRKYRIINVLQRHVSSLFFHYMFCFRKCFVWWTNRTS